MHILHHVSFIPVPTTDGYAPGVPQHPGMPATDVAGHRLEKVSDWANPVEKRKERAINDPKPMMDGQRESSTEQYENKTQWKVFNVMQW